METSSFHLAPTCIFGSTSFQNEAETMIMNSAGDPWGTQRGAGFDDALELEFDDDIESEKQTAGNTSPLDFDHHDDLWSMKRVLDFGSFSQRVVHQEENDSLLFFTEPLFQLLEPIPLGPSETQTIVSKLSPADIYWKGDRQDLISCLTAFGYDTGDIASSMNKKRRACDDDENQILLEERHLNTINKKPKFHPTVLERHHSRTPPEQQAQNDLIHSFHRENWSVTTSIATYSSTEHSDLSQQQENQRNNVLIGFSSNNKQKANESSKPIPPKSMLHPHHCDQWNDRFKDLMVFRNLYGHCHVPHDYPPNSKLAQWVKRQRCQHKLKHSGRHSTLTYFRERALEEMGFVWDSHKAAWTEKLETLKIFKAFHGHCSVPTNFDSDPSLAIWVKCQRRQYRLYCQGKQSTMNAERVSALDSLDFDWNPRRL